MCQVLHVVDFLGSRRMETAPTSIEVRSRQTQSQSDEPSNLRGSLSPTSVYSTWQSQAVTPRSHAIEMVFVFIMTGHAGSSARSFMLSQKIYLRLWVSDPVQSPVTKCPHLYLNCRRAWVTHSSRRVKTPVFREIVVTKWNEMNRALGHFCDTVIQTQDSKFEPWRSEAEHATSRSRRLPTILSFTRGWERNIFVSFDPRDLEPNPEH